MYAQEQKRLFSGFLRTALIREVIAGKDEVMFLRDGLPWVRDAPVSGARRRALASALSSVRKMGEWDMGGAVRLA